MIQEYMLPANLTPREYYRIHDKLEAAHIDCLLDSLDQVSEYPDGRAYIQEAKANLPQEDLLGTVIYELTTLAKQVRGSNRVGVHALLRSVREIQEDLIRSSEEAQDNLNKAEKGLDKFFY